jgi:hypothetical protein
LKAFTETTAYKYRLAGIVMAEELPIIDKDISSMEATRADAIMALSKIMERS